MKLKQLSITTAIIQKKLNGLFGQPSIILMVIKQPLHLPASQLQFWFIIKDTTQELPNGRDALSNVCGKGLEVFMPSLSVPLSWIHHVLTLKLRYVVFYSARVLTC